MRKNRISGRVFDVEYVTYAGWENCVRLANQELELILTSEVGPRIIRFSFIGLENEFYEFPETPGARGAREFVPYGGHRFWIAPEQPSISYHPDNSPIEIEEHPGWIRARQSAGANLGIAKVLDLRLSPDENQVEITHRLINQRDESITLAPWALTIMNQGGTGILPLPPRGSHPENLLPTSQISLWAYTGLSDPRWTLSDEYILLRQDTHVSFPQKIGGWVPDGWLAYLRNNHLFVKRFPAEVGKAYPDRGSNAELFTNADMLELESLGPLVDLEPGQQVEHIERWFLFKNQADFQNVDSAAGFARTFFQGSDNG